MSNSGKIRCGIGGWTFEPWRDNFYPKGLAHSKELAYASQQLDQDSAISASGFANWFDSGFDSTGSGTGYSASVAYQRRLISGLSGTAAVGVDGATREDLPDYTNASALVGLRYSF